MRGGERQSPDATPTFRNAVGPPCAFRRRHLPASGRGSRVLLIPVSAANLVATSLQDSFPRSASVYCGNSAERELGDVISRLARKRSGTAKSCGVANGDSHPPLAARRRGEPRQVARDEAEGAGRVGRSYQKRTRRQVAAARELELSARRGVLCCVLCRPRKIGGPLLAAPRFNPPPATCNVRDAVALRRLGAPLFRCAHPLRGGRR